MNDKNENKGIGSYYIQSKVLNAKELLEDEVCTAL